MNLQTLGIAARVSGWVTSVDEPSLRANPAEVLLTARPKIVAEIGPLVGYTWLGITLCRSLFDNLNDAHLRIFGRDRSERNLLAYSA